MCGIVGIWTTNRDRGHIRAELARGVEALRHRGPDDQGIWINGSGVALGHTRLSILDLSDLGHQPMTCDDGRYVVVFNGEIYNFADIRERLAGLGHSFRGSGDTEVILHAFRQWGPDAVQQFVGMFAIALWDETEQTLHLLRDRIGVKPLYFGWDGDTLCFASELKALRAFEHWTPDINREALGEFLQYGYISGDRSIYRGIHKLLPAHRLTLKSGQQPIIEPYWSLIALPRRKPDQDFELELEQLLISAFRYRMVSDVPVGIYLSGGVDSSLVTAMLSKHHDKQIRTFTIGFEEDDHDESRWARKVAEHCGTQHREYILGVSEALQIARDWGTLFDEPFGDSSGIPTLLVSRLAREQVKVVLSADGGDELFSGYGVYSTVLKRLEELARAPDWVRRTSSSALSAVPTGRLDHWIGRDLMPARMRGSVSRKTSRLRMMLASATPNQMMDAYTSYWYPSEIRRLIGSYDPPRSRLDSYPGTPIDQISLRDFHNYLPEDILTKVDRTTMAVSIEGREPLLDHRIAEFAFRLPPHLRRGSLGPKHILKKILYRYVPRELVDRPKQGFGIPLGLWLRSDLRELLHDYLSEHRIRNAGLMDARLIRRLLDEFDAGNEDLTSPLWFILAFEMWRAAWG